MKTTNEKTIKNAHEQILELDINDNNNWIQNASQKGLKRYTEDLGIIDTLNLKGSNVIDIGAAPFVLPLALHNSGYSVSCVDIAPERYKNIKKLPIKVKKCDIEKDKLPFRNDSFDLIVFNAVFEHLRLDLIFTLSEMRRVLKKDGKLILSTPNLKSIKGIYNFLVRNISYSASGNLAHEWSKIKRLGHMGHVREYTPKEVRQLCEGLGFNFKTVIYSGEYNRTFSGRVFNIISKVFPQFKPHFTIIFRK